jgi:hypothetical protein
MSCRIDGWSYPPGMQSCTATFAIAASGMLADELQDGGCVKR